MKISCATQNLLLSDLLIHSIVLINYMRGGGPRFINLMDVFQSNSVVQVCGLPPGASPPHLVPVELCSQGFPHPHHLQKSQCQRQHRSDIYPCLLLLLSHRGFSVKFSCSSPHLVDHTPPVVVGHHIACLGTSFELQRQQNSRDSIKGT